MKIVRKNESKEYKNAETCVAYEYITDDDEINIARVVIDGRYPMKGYAVNKEVKELVYVESGSGTIITNGTDFAISSGDVISIAQGEKIAWMGQLTLIISSSPAWTPDQYEIA